MNVISDVNSEPSPAACPAVTVVGMAAMSAGVETRHARGGTLVAGGGFAGAYVARLLGGAGATIVSPENFMLYTPMLPEAASGTLEPRHCVVPVRVMARHAELVLGEASSVDLGAHVVRVTSEGG